MAAPRPTLTLADVLNKKNFMLKTTHHHAWMKNWICNLFIPHKKRTCLIVQVAGTSFINQVLTPPVCKFYSICTRSILLRFFLIFYNLFSNYSSFAPFHLILLQSCSVLSFSFHKLFLKYLHFLAFLFTLLWSWETQLSGINDSALFKKLTLTIMYLFSYLDVCVH